MDLSRKEVQVLTGSIYILTRELLQPIMKLLINNSDSFHKAQFTHFDQLRACTLLLFHTFALRIWGEKYLFKSNPNAFPKRFQYVIKYKTLYKQGIRYK